MKISFGMSETLVICGSALYNSSLALSLTLIALGVLGKFCHMAMEKAAEQERAKATSDSVNKFAETLEKVCVDCVEEGSMTKDLAILIGPSTKYLTTNQFLDTLDGKLRQKLN